MPAIEWTDQRKRRPLCAGRPREGVPEVTALFAALRPRQRKALQPYPYAVVPGEWTAAFGDALAEMESNCFNPRRNDGSASFVVRLWSGEKAIYVKDHAVAFPLMAMAPGDGAVWVGNPNIGEGGSDVDH